MSKMLRRSFMIEPEWLDRMRAMKARVGLSQSEQVRQALRDWFESREWPVKRVPKGPPSRGR